MSSIFGYLPLLFAFTILPCKMQFGHAAEVNMRLRLNNTEEERVVASLYIRNATSEQLRNVSLVLDIDTILDDSKDLIGARGILKETKKNKMIEFDTFHQMAMDEENQRLRSSIDEVKALISSMAEDIKRIQSSCDLHMATKDEELQKLQSTIDGIKRLQSSHDKDIKKWRFFYSDKVKSLESMGYEMHPGVGTYKFHIDTNNFESASKICEKEGAHLAIVNSDKEAAVLGKILVRREFWSAWVGVTDSNKKRDFMTIFGKSLKETGFSKWWSGEPNNVGGKEFCVEYRSGGALNDLSCDHNNGVICEIPFTPDDF